MASRTQSLAVIALLATALALVVTFRVGATTPQPPDDTHRKSWEQERGEIKRRLSAQAALEQQLRGRESEFSQMLATEQARWVELNGRLDELDRLLGPVQ